jgi:glyoxylase-like metal-dependent hydrolase (beta-lactamase superfamily II)
VIPFIREFDFAYGRVDQVSPLIRRVVANNPGPFTFTGTGTYIVGRGEVAVIDPGPLDDTHLDALSAAVDGERVAAIVITHSHLDHSPLAAQLKARTGAAVYGRAVETVHQLFEGPQLDDDDDLVFRPDVTVQDGQAITGPGWTLRAILTPGHASNHVCYALEEENALFSGDHVMGWSTTVVSPPDGDMTAYYASLDRIRAANFATLYPTHGAPITDPGPLHRRLQGPPARPGAPDPPTARRRPRAHRGDGARHVRRRRQAPPPRRQPLGAGPPPAHGAHRGGADGRRAGARKRLPLGGLVLTSDDRARGRPSPRGDA